MPEHGPRGNPHGLPLKRKPRNTRRQAPKRKRSARQAPSASRRTSRRK